MVYNLGGYIMDQKGLVNDKNIGLGISIAICVIVYGFSNCLFHGNDVKYEIKVQTKN